MRYNTWSRALVASLLILGCHAGAAAQSSLQSVFSQVELGVIDLTPDDGQTAGFSVRNVTTSYYLYLDNGGSDWQSWRNETRGIVPYTLEQSLGSGSGRIHGGTRIGELDVGLDIGASPDQSATASASQRVILQLAPHSALTLSGTYLGSGTVTGTAPTAQASALIRLQSDAMQDQFEKTYTGLHADPVDLPFWFAMANTGDTDLRIVLSFETQARMWNGVSPVPEPSTYAMLGLGLLAIGATRYRRRG